MNQVRNTLMLAVLAGLVACGAQPSSAGASDAEPPPGSDGIAQTPPPEADAVCAEDDIVCHETMYELEETLFLYEQGVGIGLEPAAASCWEAETRAFQQTLADCADRDCREAALRQRLVTLHFLQPEDRRAKLDLIEAPDLIAVLAPESGAEAPGAAVGGVPFEARGALIHAMEHPEHMGIAVAPAPGAHHVFIFDMDIGNQPGHDQVLGLVGTSPTARVLVRGQRRDAPDGVANFDTDHCRIVYQLP